MSEGGATRFGDIRRSAEVDSTNRVVADLARGGAAEGVVVVADHQTAGRGRWGRRWESPPGSSLLVSVLLRPEGAPDQVPLITLAAGVASAEAVEAVAAVGATLKWPNDVMVAEQKLGGILTELVDDGMTPAIVVGLGLNVEWNVPLPEGATALDRLTRTPVDRESLLQAFLARMDAHTTALAAPDGRRRLLERYQQLSSTLGRRVTVSVPGHELAGQATEITADGRLVVEDDDGRHEVSVGDVTHIRCNFPGTR